MSTAATKQSVVCNSLLHYYVLIGGAFESNILLMLIRGRFRFIKLLYCWSDSRSYLAV